MMKKHHASFSGKNNLGMWVPLKNKKTSQQDNQTIRQDNSKGDRTRPRVPSGTVADIYMHI